jgi:hypothetical protein
LRERVEALAALAEGGKLDDPMSPNLRVARTPAQYQRRADGLRRRAFPMSISARSPR